MTDRPDSEPDLLESYSADDLLCELRARQVRALGAERANLAGLQAAPLEVPRATTSALREVPSRSIFESLRRLQIARYGSDDRRNVTPTQPEAPYVDAVAALFLANRVRDNGDGTSSLETMPLRRRFGLCPREPFADQPSGAFATGFLVAPAQIATAAHSFNNLSLEAFLFVFGFQMLDDHRARLVVDNTQIYRGARVLGKKYEERGSDWALIELDRPVPDRAPVRLRRTGSVESGQPVYVLGHPSGLPLKYADRATVRDDRPASYFVANLDTYAGSSGSPVFNADHEVEGLVARGEKDFVLVGDCFASLVYPDTGPLGQECTRTAEFAALVPG